MENVPIAIMSFDRPEYLTKVLVSLKAQTSNISPSNVSLFQDGHISKSGEFFADPAMIDLCIATFSDLFPEGNVFHSKENLGVALNYERAEHYVFESKQSEVGYFFEDDLVVSPHYFGVLDLLTQMALSDNRIGYFAAYGNHKASLVEQQKSPSKLIRMRHKWGFGLTRRQHVAQRPIVNAYLDIVRRRPYRDRDHEAIRAYFRKLGYGSPGTSQDAAKDVASVVLGTTKIMTQACFGKYIGDVGLHSTKEIYRQEGYAATELYPTLVSSIVKPSDAELQGWLSNARDYAVSSLATK